jgi:hypothetical protein
LLTDIVIFNELFTTKWSKKNNTLQIIKFFELCLLLQSKLKALR